MNKEIRNKCKVELTHCVQVCFKGASREFPKLPSDDGVIPKFLTWCMEEKLCTLSFSGSTGGGFYTHCHRTQDAKKIKKFFEGEKVKVTEFQT